MQVSTSWVNDFQAVGPGVEPGVSATVKDEFLPRAHSEKWGDFDESNWKNLELDDNVRRVDPAIRDLILSFNEKGYTTFSSCSGGHATNPRKRIDRHERGYISFSPPSRVVFELYTALHKMNRDFGLEADVIVEDWNGDGREAIYTQLNWRLKDDKDHRRKYYTRLFSQMQEVLASLPRAPPDHARFLAGVLGRKASAMGSEVVARQKARFRQ